MGSWTEEGTGGLRKEESSGWKGEPSYGGTAKPRRKVDGMPRALRPLLLRKGP